MGKLRTVPKYRSFLSSEEYENYVKILKEAQSASDSAHVFWDLEETERPADAKKAFNYVARKLGIDVTVRQVRGKRTLAFQFRRPRALTTNRLSAAECRERILKALRANGGPMKKADILRQTGVSPSTWNLRIKELIGEGLIERRGQRRDTTYIATGS